MDARSILKNRSETNFSVQANRCARDAAQIFITRNVSALVVLDANGGLAGILSEHDLVKGQERFGASLPEVPVGELCTSRIIGCTSEDSVVELMQLMQTNGIRHLPVIDGDEVLGIISILDVMNAWVDASENEIQRLQTHVTA